jgi:integrase
MPVDLLVQSHTLSIVRQVFNYAKRNSLYKGDNPVSNVEKPREDNRRNRFLTYEEADLLLEHLGTVSHTLHDIALLSLHCGLRAGEIFKLSWSDIDFNNDTIFVKDTKSKRNRNVVMTSVVKTMLKDRQKSTVSDIVFQSRTGERITEVSRAFDRAIDHLGFNKGVTDRRLKVVFHTETYIC